VKFELTRYFHILRTLKSIRLTSSKLLLFGRVHDFFDISQILLIISFFVILYCFLYRNWGWLRTGPMYFLKNYFFIFRKIHKYLDFLTFHKWIFLKISRHFFWNYLDFAVFLILDFFVIKISLNIFMLFIIFFIFWYFSAPDSSLNLTPSYSYNLFCLYVSLFPTHNKTKINYTFYHCAIFIISVYQTVASNSQQVTFERKKNPKKKIIHFWRKNSTKTKL